MSDFLGCRRCTHDLGGAKCTAYPNGIPLYFLTGEREHLSLVGDEQAPVFFEEKDGLEE